MIFNFVLMQVICVNIIIKRYGTIKKSESYTEKYEKKNLSLKILIVKI